MVGVDLNVHLLVYIVQKLNHLVEEILAAHVVAVTPIVRPTRGYVVCLFRRERNFVEVEVSYFLFHIHLFVNHTRQISTALLNIDQQLNGNVDLLCLQIDF